MLNGTEPFGPPAPLQTSTLLRPPTEIRSVIYSRLLNAPLRLRAPCPLFRSAPPKHNSPSSLLETCRQIRDEAAPFLYHSVHFGWLANMTKALSSPARKAFYSRNIREATSQYDIGLIEDCLRAAMSLDWLQRLILLAEVPAIHKESRHISAVFKSLRLCRDDLSSVDSSMPFQVDFRLSVINLDPKTKEVRPFPVQVHAERAEQRAEKVINPPDLSRAY